MRQRQMDEAIRMKLKFSGVRVEYAIKTLQEGGYFRVSIVDVKIMGVMQKMLSHKLHTIEGRECGGVSHGTFKTFRQYRLIVPATSYEIRQYPRLYFISDKGKEFAANRQQRNKYGLWGFPDFWVDFVLDYFALNVEDEK